MHAAIQVSATMIVIAATIALAPLIYIIAKKLIPWQYAVPAISFMIYNLSIAILELLAIHNIIYLPSEFIVFIATVDILWAATTIAVVSIFVAARKLRIDIDWMEE